MEFSADQFLLFCEFAEFKSSFVDEQNGRGVHSSTTHRRKVTLH